MSRRFWLWLHRYAGLGMAVFLVIVGLTGSVLAFREDVEDWLNPTRDRVAVRNSPLLDPLVLRERAMARAPGLYSRYVDLKVLPDRVYAIVLEPPPDPVTGQPRETGALELKLDPYTGEELSRGDPTLVERPLWPVTRDNLVDVLWQFHVQMAAGPVGSLILGIVALLWVVDCFVALYLTWPARPTAGGAASLPATAPSRWRRWQRAWRIRWPASAFRVHFDLHRAGGLWTWPVMLMFAWTSGTFNLHSVFDPLNDLIFGARPEQHAAPRPQPRFEPPVPLDAALAVGRRLMAEKARLHGFPIRREYYLAYNPQTHLYVMAVHGDTLFGDQDGTYIRFDAEQARVLDLHMPSGLHASVTAREWMSALHMAAIWGWPYRAFVCLMGLAISVLSVTGVYIWWRKRRARRLAQTAFGKRPVRGARGRASASGGA